MTGKFYQNSNNGHRNASACFTKAIQKNPGNIINWKEKIKSLQFLSNGKMSSDIAFCLKKIAKMTKNPEDMKLAQDAYAELHKQTEALQNSLAMSKKREGSDMLGSDSPFKQPKLYSKFSDPFMQGNMPTFRKN